MTVDNAVQESSLQQSVGAQLRRAREARGMTSAPDCDTKARVPGRASRTRWVETLPLGIALVVMAMHPAGMPAAVSVVGMAHGVLFVAYVMAALHAERATGAHDARLVILAASDSDRVPCRRDSPRAKSSGAAAASHMVSLSSTM